MSRVVRALVWKELHQLPRRRGALLSAAIFPFFFLFLLPQGRYEFVMEIFRPEGLGQGGNTNLGGVEQMLALPGIRTVADAPALLYREFTLPFFVAMGGLVAPAITATYALISERERRSLELLLALPVSLVQIVWAKLLAVLVLTFATTLPFFLLQNGMAIARDLLSPSRTVVLLLLLLAAQTYSAASALAVSLVAADYRTANNLNGALLGPLIVAVLAILALAPPGDGRLLALAGGLVLLAGLSIFLVLRVISLERFLQ